MGLDARRAALWKALGLGPEWVERSEMPEAAQQAIARTEPAAPAAARPEPPEAPGSALRNAADYRRQYRQSQNQPARRPAGESFASARSAPQASVQPAGPLAAPVEASGLTWDELRSRVAQCQACGLCRTRTQTVFSSVKAGDPRRRIAIVGEAPGRDEDLQGEPFVGRAGQLLDSILVAMGLSRTADVAIINVLKCRPPQNRNPQPAEMAACSGFLSRQLELIDPQLIVLMGRFAMAQVLGVPVDTSVGSCRHRIHHVSVAGAQRPAVVTYHPSYLLRSPGQKVEAWADWCLALDALDAAGPASHP